MGKAIAIGEIIFILKEMWDSTSDFFMESIPNDFYKSIDKMAFISSDILNIGNNGEFLDKTQNIANAVMNLSNLLIWGVLLFYGFRCLFNYLWTKTVDIPWKFFMRIIVFGIFANASFFICYIGVFFTENCTEYIREYCGEDKISFRFLEEYMSDTDIESDLEGESNIYTFDVLISIFIYFLTFFAAVCLAGRYILIKVLILLSPLFFIFGGAKFSEKIFFKWCRIFFSLLCGQIIFCIVLGVVNLSNFSNELILPVLICATLFIICKYIVTFLNLLR